MASKKKNKKRKNYKKKKNNSLKKRTKSKVNIDNVFSEEKKGNHTPEVDKKDKNKENKNSMEKCISSKQVKKDSDKKKDVVRDREKLMHHFHNYCINNSRKKNVFIWCVIISLFIFAFVFYFSFLLPRIDLVGKSTVVINYGEKYKELGYKAFYQGKDITDRVKVLSNVKSKKIGTYKVYYKVKYASFYKTVMRRVIVKDIRGPKITFSDKEGTIYVCPLKKYKIAKYKAIDNYDGDVTKRVKVIEKKDYILYMVSDKAGNKTKIKRDIKYIDKEGAKINLIGGDTLYTFIGEEFKDPGYKALDNCDGDITKRVDIDGRVDTNKVGEYKIKYHVLDKAGNKSEAVRKVKVVEHDKNGSVYLTFDDGPKEGTTDVILDILKEEGVKATFFVTNSGPDELIKRASDEGHTVALHTSSHNYSLVYSSDDAYFYDLYSVFDRVKRVTGKESKFIRFPGGSSNTVSRRYSSGIMSRLTSEVVNRGFKYYDWNLSSGDAEAGVHTSSEIYHNVVDHLSKDRVNMVLMHDIKPYTRDALRDIIQYCKSNGYTLEAISDSTEMIKQAINN